MKKEIRSIPSSDKLKTIMSECGLAINTSEAKEMLDFLRKLAELAVNHYLRR